MNKEKKPSAFSRLMGYAGGHAGLTWLSLVLSAVSAVVGLLPFVCLWRIIKEVIEVRPDFSQAAGITKNGWLAVSFAVISWLIYIAG